MTPSEKRWRIGALGRNILAEEGPPWVIGTMESPELAAHVVARHNEWLAKNEPHEHEWDQLGVDIVVCRGCGMKA